MQKLWDRFDVDTPLRVVDCPDRDVTRAAQELVAAERNQHPDTNVTVLLPRRAYGPLERLLHDRTADKIAKAVSRTPGAAATIVPYDVQSRISEAFPNKVEQRIARGFADIEARIWQGETRMVASYEHPERSPGVVAMDKLTPGRTRDDRRPGQRSRGRHQTAPNLSSRSSSATTAGRSASPSDRSTVVRKSFPANCSGSRGGAQRREQRSHIMADPAYQVVE